jgi:hypothetical protein
VKSTGACEAEKEPNLFPQEEGGERRPRRDFFGALLLLALSSAFVAEALRHPFKGSAWEWYTSPTIFPLGTGMCLGVCSLIVAVRGFVGWRADQVAIGPIRWAAGLGEWGMVRFLAGATMIVAFLFLLGKVNFYLLAALTIMSFGTSFRSGSLSKALKASAIAATVVVVFLYIIGRIFGIVFP